MESKINLNKIYQFKISLVEIKPLIWRRIQVPANYTFYDLHVAIQDSMGWADYHLHQFTLINPNTKQKADIGIPDDEYGEEILPGWEHKICDWLHDTEDKAIDYMYDFGDSWHHKIKLEKILPVEKDNVFPKCIDGERACPPEDVGGIPGYYNFIAILKNKKHPEYEEMSQWNGGGFDPEYFDLNQVIFDNPDERYKDKFE